MNTNIFNKLSDLRDKYPDDTKLIEQLALVAFRNNGEIPKSDFDILGYGYKQESLIKILAELDIHFEDITIVRKMSPFFTRCDSTGIQYK